MSSMICDVCYGYIPSGFEAEGGEFGLCDCEEE